MQSKGGDGLMEIDKLGDLAGTLEGESSQVSRLVDYWKGRDRRSLLLVALQVVFPLVA